MSNNIFDDVWGEYSSIGNNPQKDKSENIQREKKYEEKILKELSKTKRKIKILPYLCYDEEGNEVAQVIETKYGKVRCPDLYVQEDDFWESILLRIEVKHQSRFYENVFLRIECDKFEDYLKVQSSEEIEGRVIFIVDEVGKVYWKRLSDLDYSKERIYIKEFGGWNYVWNHSNLNLYKDEEDFFNSMMY